MQHLIMINHHCKLNLRCQENVMRFNNSIPRDNNSPSLQQNNPSVTIYCAQNEKCLNTKYCKFGIHKVMTRFENSVFTQVYTVLTSHEHWCLYNTLPIFHFYFSLAWVPGITLQRFTQLKFDLTPCLNKNCCLNCFNCSSDWLFSLFFILNLFSINVCFNI